MQNDKEVRKADNLYQQLIDVTRNPDRYPTPRWKRVIRKLFGAT